MFMNDVNKKEEIRNIAIKDLRAEGIKFRPKKPRHNVQETRIGRRIFKTSLHLLPMQTVTLTSGQQLVVPKLVHDLCSYILTKVETEGLFRKGGSKARQNEIRLSLDAGCLLGDEHHEVDVANVLKTFFRELPEPLFPYSFHEPFLRCTILKENKLHALLLMCLLLPSEHLNTLAYFMQFLYHVTQFSSFNKMDSYNLAVVIVPTILPVDEKLANNATLRLTKTCELFKLLIENAGSIGVIPEDIIDRIASLSSANSHSEDEVPNTKRKKKRRSGSLTRMFNGLKKIVSSKSLESDTPPSSVTPDLLITPNLTKSAKKRRREEGGGFSYKKKRELLQSLPQGTALSTPISVNPNPNKVSPPKSVSKNNHYILKEKKSQWNLGSKRNKQSKQDDRASTNSNAFAGTRAVLERRWSAVSQAAGFRKNKTRNSCSALSLQPKTADSKLEDADNNVPDNNCDIVLEEKQIPEPDYVKISRTEYEEIKNRVSAIEQRISLELENFSHDGSVVEQQSSSESDDVFIKVQTAYEKTLVEAEPLSPTTDQLARRLSKDLKIRRSYEQKVVRSPSARKIGTLRRRSRELERQHTKIHRIKSWHVDRVEIIPRVNLKRGKPNTVMTGLRYPSPLKVNNIGSDNSLETQVIKTPARATSFHGNLTPKQKQNYQRSSLLSNYGSANKSNSLISEKWTSAEGFFHEVKLRKSASTSLNNTRESLAKLRSQNAGMVLAKARLFNGLIESDHSANSESSATFFPRARIENRIGATRNMSNRMRSLRCDDKHVIRHNSTPKKKSLKSPKQNCNVIASTPLHSSIEEKENQMHTSTSFNNADFLDSTEKVQVAVLKDCNRIDISDIRSKTVSPGYVTPKGMPQLKRSLTVRSSKKLCKTPLRNENKQTPLKIVTSSKVY